MRKRFTSQLITATSLILMAFLMPAKSSGQAITEGFDNITTLPASGWSLQNLSDPLGSTGWFQGNASTFTSQNGANNSYIAADQNNTTNGGTISNWLITPNRTLRNGDVVTFYTRTVAASLRPDRLQVRMSSAGSSTNVGTTATSVGDFTTLLLDINASQTLLLYPGTFTQYTITISGLTAPTSGRLAFRYFVTNAGAALGGNSNYIGIDNFVYTPLTCPAFTVNPATIPNPVYGTAYSQTFTTANGSGTPTYAITSGALPAGLTLSSGGVLSGTPTVSGTFTFVVTSSDVATGCSGSRSYTVTIACPSFIVNPLTTSNGVAGSPYTASFLITPSTAGPATFAITTGSVPTGLSLTNAGVLSGTPTTSGTYNFTVTATNASGCTASRAYTIVISCPASTVTLAPFNAVCSNATPVTLTGGSPSGGTYSGTGVSNGTFNPTVGTQVITYTSTNSFGCTYSASQTFTVNAAPAITFSSLPALCSDALPFTLSNASPTGGAFVGDSLRNGVFFPSSGTQTIKYIVTNSAGCSDSASQTITIKQAPIVTLDTSFNRLCAGGATVTLTGGTPAGGSFTGTNVDTAGRFNPSTIGSYVIGYTVVAANGCSASAVKTISVVDCNATPTTGIGHINNTVADNTLICYPNPTTGNITVQLFTPAKNSEVLLRVVNIEGRVVYQQVIKGVNGIAETALDLNSYPKGLYMIQVKMASGFVSRKVMLQ